MKNNKGFTFIELLAVISILAIITTLTVVSYNIYMESAKEKELGTLRGTVEQAFETYRSDLIINSDYTTDNSRATLLQLQGAGRLKDFTFHNKKFTNEELNVSYITVITKGNYVNAYKNEYGNSAEEKMLEDGICEKNINDENVFNCSENEKDENGNCPADTDKLNVSCLKDDYGNIIGSSEEAYCLYIYHNKKELIDDFDNTDGKLYCR